MAQILVRNLPDDVKARLQRRAKVHKRSLEAEVREILSQAPEASKLEGDVFAKLSRKFAELPVTDEDTAALEHGMSELRTSWRVRDVGLD
jgi:antitoxin FitA